MEGALSGNPDLYGDTVVSLLVCGCVEVCIPGFRLRRGKIEGL